MALRDYLSDGYGLIGPNIFDRFSSLASKAVDTVSDLLPSGDMFSGLANNTISNIKEKATKKITRTSDEVNVDKLLKLDNDIKLEDIVNEDNIRFLPKEAPKYWLDNGGTWETWVIKKILEGENAEHAATHSSGPDLSSSTGSSYNWFGL